MSSSGTTAFTLNLGEVCEEAWERAGSELRSGYDLRTTRRSLNIMFADWASRGINMWTMANDTITLVAGTATYNLPTDCVDLLEQVIRTNAGVTASQADLTITRVSISTYATIPNKLSEGRPVQILVNRVAPTPTVTVWPVPDDSVTYTLAFWYLRRIEDAGSAATTTMDLPFRFLPVLAAGLAFYVAAKIPEGQPRLPFLEAQYEAAWELAAGEDRERASVRLVPRMARV